MRHALSRDCASGEIYLTHIGSKFLFRITYKKILILYIPNNVYRPPVCLRTAVNYDPENIRHNGTHRTVSFSIGVELSSHTCIRNNGIKPRGATPPLCGEIYYKAGKITDDESPLSPAGIRNPNGHRK